MLDIIIDTREQTPWVFTSVAVGSVTQQKLDTGDYTIKDFQDIFCIERKKNVSEIAHNIWEERFDDELIRLSSVKHAFLILEFGIDDILAYPIGSSIPPKKWKTIKTNGQLIIKRLSEIIIKYRINILYCGNTSNAILVATSLMKRIYEFNKQ